MKFPTGGNLAFVKKPASASPSGKVSRSGEMPEPTVIVRMKEGDKIYRKYNHIGSVMDFLWGMLYIVHITHINLPKCSPSFNLFISGDIHMLNLLPIKLLPTLLTFNFGDTRKSEWGLRRFNVAAIFAFFFINSDVMGMEAEETSLSSLKEANSIVNQDDVLVPPLPWETVCHFPPYELIAEVFEKRLEERDARGENPFKNTKKITSLLGDYERAHTTPLDDELYYEYGHTAVHVFYEGLMFKCRVKSDFIFEGNKRTKMPGVVPNFFNVEVDCTDWRRTGKPEIKGEYHLKIDYHGNQLWIWPILSDLQTIRLGLPVNKIKSEYMAFSGYMCDPFFGYKFVLSPSHLPLFRSDSARCKTLMESAATSIMKAIIPSDMKWEDNININELLISDIPLDLRELINNMYHCKRAALLYTQFPNT